MTKGGIHEDTYDNIRLVYPSIYTRETGPLKFACIITGYSVVDLREYENIVTMKLSVQLIERLDFPTIYSFSLPNYFNTGSSSLYECTYHL